MGKDLVYTGPPRGAPVDARKDVQATIPALQLPRRQQFVRERRYLTGVTPATLAHYAWAFTALDKHGPTGVEVPTKAQLREWVVALQQHGMAAATINSLLTAINAYMRWLHEEGYSEALVRIPKVRGVKPLIRVLPEKDLAALVGYRPTLWRKHRIATAALLVVDTGLRQAEVLGLRWADVDLDQLQLRVLGKGQKERIAPCSPALRKRLLLWQRATETHHVESPLVFPSEYPLQTWSPNNALRSMRLLWHGLGCTPYGWHILRHTFATNYLRYGGDITRLSLILGHTSVTTTQRYVHLLAEDLGVHTQQVSPLHRYGRRG